MSADFLLICSGLHKQSREGWLPSKVFEYMGCSRPIIAVCRDGELAQLIRDTNCGFLFHDEDPKPIVQFLEQSIKEKTSNGAVAHGLSFDGTIDYREDRVFAYYEHLMRQAVGKVG